MYTRLSKIMTKKYYREIVDKALVQAKEEYSLFPNIPMNISIYNQIIDIKKRVIEEGVVFTEEESRKRYTLGVLVIRNFIGDEGETDYANMLIDIAGGVSRYPKMIEGDDPKQDNPRGGWSVFD